MVSSLVVATYDQVRLTPRFLAALHLDLFDQPAPGMVFFSILLSRDVGEEVFGTARRGPGGAGIGTLGREPEMGENPADDPRILNGRDQTHAPARRCEGKS